MVKKVKPNDDNLVTNALLNRIIKASGNEYASTLNNADIINNKENFILNVPAMNLGFSGQFDIGMGPGIWQIVGESKSFKTLFLLIAAKSYMDKYPQSVFIIFDSEFGAAAEYFDMVGIDPARVGWQPISTVEDLTIQANKIVDDIKPGEKVFLGVDSIGLLPSKKEKTDAINGDEKQDMTRARAISSFARTMVGSLPVKGLSMGIVNHSYDSIGGFIPTKTVKGGKNLYLASEYIWMVTRAVEKENNAETDKKELSGFKFSIWIEKSRKVKEKSKLPIYVSFEHGIDKYSGLDDLAVEGNFINHVKGETYQLPDDTQVKYGSPELNAYFDKLLVSDEFNAFIKQKYQLTKNKLVQYSQTKFEESDE